MFFFFTPDFMPKLPGAVTKFLERESLTWDEFETLLSACRRKHPDLTVGALRTFVFIARRAARDAEREPTIKDVAIALEIGHGTARRHCEILSKGPSGRKGLGWIEKKVGDDARVKHLGLTAEGVCFLISVVSEMNKREPPLKAY
ncbi:hypothetical protein [Ruegeria atlantica]|uniref:hypothetical protein n=1 Tax=Ruegeria atlantica TaxID=81569 RepID=UPI00147B82C4|nr:hypothetical protein [Ruegeria atlantica]